jgi:hypothetical protein
LVKVLFEPKAKLSDSLTYDITAWSLPYAYGLEAIASPSLVTSQNETTTATTSTIEENSYAHVTDWNSMKDARFLAELLNNNIRVRKSNHPFIVEGKSFERGSLIIVSDDNKNHPQFWTSLKEIARKHDKTVMATSSGLVDSGKDFGSSSVRLITKPKIAVLSGEPTSTYRFGEIWHFFEKQLNYPISVLDGAYFKSVDLGEYQILVLPDGNYSKLLDEKELKKLTDWTRNGGKLIVMGRAIQAMAKRKNATIKMKKRNDSPQNVPKTEQKYTAGTY